MVVEGKSILYVFICNEYRGDEWSLRAFASMPSTAIFLRARAEIKNLLCELASNCKNLGSTSKRALVKILRANRTKVKFCEQLKFLMDHSSPLSICLLKF